jgi:hypothetical protein
MAQSEKDGPRGRTPGRRLLWTPTAGQDETKSYFPLSEGTSPEARVRDVVARHHSLYVSELVKLAGVPESEARAVLDEMARKGEGYWSKDIIRKEDVFTASPANIGKTIITRRLQEQADRLKVPIERVEWAPAPPQAGEPAFTLNVTSAGQPRAAEFTTVELEEIAEGEENKDIINSRLFNLVSPYKVRRIV